MLYADQVGLFNVVQSMKRFAAEPAGRRQILEARAAAGQAGAEGKTFNQST
jgi:3-hydroxyacyl-CoA dehydrogenase